MTAILERRLAAAAALEDRAIRRARILLNARVPLVEVLAGLHAAEAIANAMRSDGFEGLAL